MSQRLESVADSNLRNIKQKGEFKNGKENGRKGDSKNTTKM